MLQHRMNLVRVHSDPSEKYGLVDTAMKSKLQSHLHTSKIGPQKYLEEHN